MYWSPGTNILFQNEFSTTEDEQSGNPINFANDFIKLDSHLAIKAKFILRIDLNVELFRITACNLQTKEYLQTTCRDSSYIEYI